MATVASANAEELLELALAAHGGMARWQTISEIVLRLRVRGNILAPRFLSPRLRSLEVVIDTRRTRATFRDFPYPGATGVFDGDTVRITTAEGIVSQRAEARRSCQQRLVWDNLNLLYFFGYAFWNYTMTPFLFAWPGFQLRELTPYASPGQPPWRRLEVTFPPTIPTHSTVQTFYFDATGLLRRLDYTAEIFSRFARGAHLLEAHKTFSGLVYPSHRKILLRGPSGRPIRGPSAMEGWIDDVTVIE